MALGHVLFAQCSRCELLVAKVASRNLWCCCFGLVSSSLVPGQEEGVPSYHVTLVTGVLSLLAWSWKTRRVNLVKRIFWLELIENLGKYEELRLVLIIRVLYLLKPLKNVENLWEGSNLCTPTLVAPSAPAPNCPSCVDWDGSMWS